MNLKSSRLSLYERFSHKKSNINGRGVFAKRNFRKGEKIIKWKILKILTKSEATNFPELKKKYVSRLGKNKYALLGSPAKFVNHSCDSNTSAKNGFDIAKKDIQKSEEITANYESEGILKGFSCKCKSLNCKKNIIA